MQVQTTAIFKVNCRTFGEVLMMREMENHCEACKEVEEHISEQAIQPDNEYHEGPHTQDKVMSLARAFGGDSSEDNEDVGPILLEREVKTCPTCKNLALFLRLPHYGHLRLPIRDCASIT